MRFLGSIYLFARAVLNNKTTLPDGSAIFDAVLHGSCIHQQPIGCSLRYSLQDGGDKEIGVYDICAKVRIFFFLSPISW